METQLIQSNPQIMMGKPVVSGTRITVELILEKLAALVLGSFNGVAEKQAELEQPAR